VKRERLPLSLNVGQISRLGKELKHNGIDAEK
jgi:hypothetical protein